MGILAKIKRGRENLPPRILLYGIEGIGKSTFAAGAPSPVFIQTEDGLSTLDVARFDLCSKYPEVLENLRGLRDETHEFQTVVIDSLDWLERLVHEWVVQQDGATSIELACGGYGRGYKKALDHFRDLIQILDQLRAQGMIVILVAHSKTERFEDPEHPAYDRFTPRLHKDANALFCEWCDTIGFATRKTAIKTTETNNGGKRVLATGVGAGGGGRILRVNGSPACVAKNRYGISDELPLNWVDFVRAMTGEVSK